MITSFLPTTVAIGLGLCSMVAAAHRDASAPRAPTMPPARFLRFPSFMGRQRAAEILHGAALRSSKLQPSTVTGNVMDYRKSQLLWTAEEVAPDVVRHVERMTPGMLRVLRVGPFQPSEIESQVTVSGDGDFFKKHTDNGSPDTASRKLSWVYYVHRTPRPFAGGELVMYGARGPDGKATGAYVIEPENDSLIVFPSDCFHEVKPVVTLSPSPYDARVTVNGWVRA